MSIAETCKDLYIRDLNRLKKEMKSYRSEENMWLVQGDIINSGGNLCLHLIGNLKAFVGKEIGGIDYTRDRAFEFNGKNVSLEKLIADIDEVIEVVTKTFDELTQDKLAELFPVQIWEEKKTNEFMIFHLYGHLNYHLGQINYHRRMVGECDVA